MWAAGCRRPSPSNMFPESRVCRGLLWSPGPDSSGPLAHRCKETCLADQGFGALLSNLGGWPRGSAERVGCGAGRGGREEAPLPGTTFFRFRAYGSWTALGRHPMDGARPRGPPERLLPPGYPPGSVFRHWKGGGKKRCHERASPPSGQTGTGRGRQEERRGRGCGDPWRVPLRPGPQHTSRLAPSCPQAPRGKNGWREEAFF